MAETTTAGRQKAVIPPVIRKDMNGEKLTLHRVKEGAEEFYMLESAKEVLCTFNAWQYHALNALFSHGGEAYDTLLVGVNDRFGLALDQEDIAWLFEQIRERDLFDKAEATRHPLLKEFFRNAPGTLKKMSAEEKKECAPTMQEKRVAWWNPKKLYEHAKERLVTDMENAVTGAAPEDVERLQKRQGVKTLFNPTEFLKIFQPTLAYGRYLAYPLPVLAFTALFIAGRDATIILRDLGDVLMGLGLLGHMFLGLVTVNVLAVLTTACVVYGYGGTVTGVGITWFFKFLPRFVVSFEDTEKFSRRQKLGTYAAPLMARLGLFSVMMLAWSSTRHLQGVVPDFALAVAFIAFVSFMVTSCPFYKNSGYYFLAEFLGEPHLRGKATKALLNRFNKDAYVQAGEGVLLTYALVSIGFMLALSVAVFVLLNAWLRIEIGGKSILVVSVLAALFVLRTWKQMKAANEIYHRNYRFERWRERALPEDRKDNKMPDKAKRGPMSGRQQFALVTLIVALFLPYNYQPSGRVVLLPVTQQMLSTDIEGVVGEVYYDGGEFLKKGTMVAKLADNDNIAQLEVYKARYAEQEIVAKFADEKCARQEEIYKKGAIPLDKMAEVREACAAAQAELLTLAAQIRMYEDRIRRSAFVMPFDGRLSTLHLKERVGHFLKDGEPLAAVQDESAFKVVLEVPESDLAYVKEGDRVEIRTSAWPETVFEGAVQATDPDIEDKPYGRVVKMIVSVENQDGKLKSGMTGYAKTEGKTLSVWEVLTRAAHRFVTVELWALLP